MEQMSCSLERLAHSDANKAHVRGNSKINGSSESVEKQKHMLENELMRLESQLQLSQKVRITFLKLPVKQPVT